MAIKPGNIKALETGSGISWDDWLDFLEHYKELSHTDMARVVYEKIMEAGLSKSPEWWAQNVTVAYEQHIGRRKPGQQSSGSYSVTVSKTLDGDMDEVLHKWQGLVGEMREFNGSRVVGGARTSQTEKWRYWRCDFEDGSKLSVNIQQKPRVQKCIISVNHDKLKQADDVEKWRDFWKGFLSGYER